MFILERKFRRRITHVTTLSQPSHTNAQAREDRHMRIPYPHPYIRPRICLIPVMMQKIEQEKKKHANTVIQIAIKVPLSFVYVEPQLNT